VPRWPKRGAPTPREAAALQEKWRAQVMRRKTFGAPRTVAGVDVGVKHERATAAVCVFTFPALELVESATAAADVVFPYVPGLLGFREVPCLLAAMEKLERVPDVCLVDGHGEAHPRRFGVACQLGVETDLPTIGCGKSLFVGEHREPGERRGCHTRLLHRGELIGRAVRTRHGVKPIYVSIGHRVDLDSAVRLVLRCTRRYRLPDPIRAAHATAAR
jgi:deoxyribonuclease V